MSVEQSEKFSDGPALGVRQSTLPVPDLSIHPVGRNATRKPGLQQLRLLRHLGLTAKTRLLEIGCGVGRLVYELADTITDGSYHGFDIAPKAIHWLQENYAPQLPNFRFELVKAENRRYNPNGKQQASSVSFPFPSRSYDMLCAFSVFTHMLPADIEHYLVEVERVLAEGGRGVLTFFAIQESDGPCGLSGLGEDFVPLPGFAETWTTSLEVPERAIAFSDRYVRDIIARSGLQLMDYLRGTWRQDGSSEGTPARGEKRPSFHKDVFVVESIAARSQAQFHQIPPVV